MSAGETLFNAKGFARLDFDEIRRIAAMVKFDIYEHARRKKSCGPGCDYLVNDKRYYATLLLKHIDALVLQNTCAVPPEALDWLGKAQTATREYAEIEQKIVCLPKAHDEGPS